MSVKDELDVKNRLVSILHGLILVFFAGYEFYFKPGSCGDDNTSFEQRLMTISVGYFIYDFLCMAYYGLLDMTMIIHHLICIVGMSMSICFEHSANSIVNAMFIAEVSNPAMHLRTILKLYRLTYTKAYELMEISFMLLYIYGRLLVGPSITWSTCRCASNHIILKICAIAL